MNSGRADELLYTRKFISITASVFVVSRIKKRKQTLSSPLKAYHQSIDEQGDLPSDEASVGRGLRVRRHRAARPVDADDVVVAVFQERCRHFLTRHGDGVVTDEARTWRVEEGQSRHLTWTQLSNPVFRKPWTMNLVGRPPWNVDCEMVVVSVARSTAS